MDYEETRELHNLLFTFSGLFYEKIFLRFRKDHFNYPDLKKNHIRILSVLSQFDNVTPTKLWKMLDIEKGSLTALIDHLDELGLLIRMDDPSDRRKTLLSLTPAGKAEMDSIINDFTGKMNVFFQDLDPDEMGKFVDSLRFVVTFMKKL
ncbi:MAG: MarR family winged helix-turn-helix transcriptional regulator [Chitinophagales bacterium]